MLHLDHLAKVYGEKVVLRNVTASFAPGSVSLLAGSNGAGKSTLLRIVAGLARPTSGTLRFRDPEPTAAYLGHATFVYPGLSALENLAFWNGVHDLRRSRSELLALLEHVGLGIYAHERAGVFSRGMAQRLNLARVLMLRADLLLLDEPGTGLDAASLTLLRREIRAARERGACVLIVSHDWQGDAPLADRVLRLERGRLKEEDSAALLSNGAATVSPAGQEEHAC